MAGQPNTYNDGNWTAGFNYGADKITYPFINYPTKDTNAKVYEVTRAVLPVNYTPQAALATYSGNPNAYLVDESDIQIDPLQRARYSIKFATIPANQSQGISRSITRPQPRQTYVTNIVTGASNPLIVQWRNNAANVATDGCFIGNCIVSATEAQLFAPAYQVSSSNGNYATISNTSGFNASNSIAILSNGTDSGYMLILPNGYWSITNSTTINTAPGFFTANLTQKIAPYLKAYSPGTPTIRTNQTESFYLPTVSAGVTTFADIPLPTIIANDVDYFNAVSSNASNLAANTVVYDYDGPLVWMGPIYKVTQWQVKCSDL